MNKKPIVTIILVSFVFIVLAGCAPPTPIWELGASNGTAFVPTPFVGTCSAEHFAAPLAVRPSYELVTSLQPSIEWDYPIECLPDLYRLEITDGEDFDSGSVRVETIPGYQESHDLMEALEPATYYRWRVRAVIGDDPGDYSFPQAFWTGPLCEFGLLPPMPREPANGAVVQDDSPKLIWEYSNRNCLPSGFHFEVARDVDFTDLAIWGDGDSPGTSFDTNIPYLDDCGKYYWTVAARNATSFSGTETSIFYSDFDDTCPQLDCNAADLPQPELIWPVGGEILNDVPSGIRYRWAYDDSNCYLSGFYYEVYSGEDLASTPEGEGFGLNVGPVTQDWPPIRLPNCTTYQWRVAAVQGTEIGPFSGVETFTTDFTDTCDTSSAGGVSWISMACLGEQRMMVSFEFPDYAKDDFRASVGKRDFECQVSQDDPRRLYCFGLFEQEGIVERLILERISTEEQVLVQEISIVCPEGSDGGEGGPPACNTLVDQASCDARPDCTWIWASPQAYCAAN